MALAIHRYGIQSGRSEALCQAAASYNNALALVGTHALTLYPEIGVIILGIMCNLAHIHLELRQIPEFLSARATLRYLMSKISLSQMSMTTFAFLTCIYFVWIDKMFAMRLQHRTEDESQNTTGMTVHFDKYL
jgi:hypothetical protein